MSNKPNTISELIDQWSTITEFASEIGCGYEAARQMRRRQSIAPEHWPSVVLSCHAKGIEGVTFEWLAQQRAQNVENSARPVQEMEE